MYRHICGKVIGMVGGFRKMAIWALICLAGLGVGASRSEAQAKLRYRFTSGEMLNYELQQDLKTIMAATVGPLMDMSATLQIDSTWEVTSVSPEGKAKIMVRFDRIRSRQSDFGSKPVEYDTNDQNEPSDSLMKIIFGVLKSLIGPDVELTIDPLGNVTDVKIAERAETALSRLPEGSGRLINADGLKRMISRSWQTLPEQPVGKDKPWQQATSIKQVVTDGRTAKGELASINTESTYNWDGKTDVGGKSLDRITFKTKVSIIPDERFAKISIHDQAGDGTALFDSAAGRLVETKLKQETTVALFVGSMKVDEHVEQTLTLKLKSKSK